MSKRTTATVKTAIRPRVTVDELKTFVGVFQSETSVSEVAATMGWTIEKVRTQATRLRKRGVPLRDFPKQSSLSDIDIESLTEICKAP